MEKAELDWQKRRVPRKPRSHAKAGERGRKATGKRSLSFRRSCRAQCRDQCWRHSARTSLTRAASPAYPVQEWRPTGPRWFQPWMNPQHDKPHHEQEDIPPAHLPQWEKPQAERSSLAAEPRVLEVAKADLNPRPPTLVTAGREGNNSPVGLPGACFPPHLEGGPSTGPWRRNKLP